MSSNGSRMIQFGVFEVDQRAGELRRNGARVKLQEQPFQILALLLERPGEVVTREELQEPVMARRHFCRLRPQSQCGRPQAPGRLGRQR